MDEKYSNSDSYTVPWNVPYGTEMDIRPGEYVMRSLFREFTILTEKKIETIMTEPTEKTLSKILQKGEDCQFDQLLCVFGSVAEHCLPSLLKALFSWYERQMAEPAQLDQKKSEVKQKSIIYMVAGNSAELLEKSESDIQREKRDLAVEFIFCLALIEVLKQLPFHPGHEDLVLYIENLAFKHFRYREGIQGNPNAPNIHIISDLYAEVIGVLAQSRFMSVRMRFMNELKELKAKEVSPYNTQSIISLLMGMKFFRVKMVPIEEFEASFQFMQECAQYFLEVKDKDIKHALAGLFVEILVPVAAAVKNEVNVPCLKNFVELLYSQTLDASTKAKHRLALFPLVTCLLCVSQKQFFLQNWHYFLAMCLSNLKNRDPKMCRVALESLYRLLWVYMIRIKCESNTATHSRLQSIVNSLFPKGSKGVVPRDTPLNIFVKIIQFIAQERLDFAMREIVYDLLSVGRPFKIILTPERMNIGLRAFLVVADGLQQKEGEPPMPRSVEVLPSGNTLRVRKTFLNKLLTEDTARSIGINAYLPHVRRVFVDILRALDTQYGRPLMMTNTQNINKEPDEMITGERKPRIDLFRTCVAAIPRLTPAGMSRLELIDILSRLTVHVDEELRGLAYQSLQNLMIDFVEWRQDVLYGLTQFLAKDVMDTFPVLVDNGLKMILTLLCAWKGVLTSTTTQNFKNKERLDQSNTGTTDPITVDSASVLHMIEAMALVVLCHYRVTTKRIAVLILKEVKTLFKALLLTNSTPAIDVIDRCCPQVIKECLPFLPPAEKAAVLISVNIDLQWLADRTSSCWSAGLIQEDLVKSTSTFAFDVVDPWSFCIFSFLQPDVLPMHCPNAIAHTWAIISTRLNALYHFVDPTPPNDNRASILRSSATLKKTATERDTYLHLWKNYITFAFRVVPRLSNFFVRSASPELCLSSSPESLNTERTDPRFIISGASPASLYKLVLPLLRCEMSDIRDAVIFAVGHVNGQACRDVFDELAIYIREAVDKKQENVRRRRRRDALRLHLTRLLELVAENGTFSSCLAAKEAQLLHPCITEFIEGLCSYLENEPDKSLETARELTVHFSSFLCNLIKSFDLDTRKSLFKRDLRKSLFHLFSSWSGKFGLISTDFQNIETGPKIGDLQLASLQAMSAILCCGPYFDTAELSDDCLLNQWLYRLLNNDDEKIYNLAQETVILLLESNPDIGLLLDWIVDKCYTAAYAVADRCFLALATIFSAKDYPCDHYTAIINVTLMNAGCPRIKIRDTALQLLLLLDKRFFGTTKSLPEDDSADSKKDTLDKVLAISGMRSQDYLSRQLALLHPEITMPMFSEILCRFQTARWEVKQLLLQYLLPWLQNMELVDPNVPPSVSHLCHFNDSENDRILKEGWGSVEATEMVLNNIFYITAKFGVYYPKEIGAVWEILCNSWSNNLRIILRYLIIMSGIAPLELLPIAKRVVLYLARVQPMLLMDEIMLELQTVETFNCSIERTETPPFYRLSVMRKTFSHSDGLNGTIDSDRGDDITVEKGTIHTKRHSGEDTHKSNTNNHNKIRRKFEEEPPITQIQDVERVVDEHLENLMPPPHPLPMPEYGGYFAPLTEYLPSSSLPIPNFHRCNIGVMLLCDVVADGIDIDWTVHLPLILHILFLGLDHNRTLIHEQSKQLLLNLLITLGHHNDPLAVAHILLNRANKMELGDIVLPLDISEHSLLESESDRSSYVQTNSMSKDEGSKTSTLNFDMLTRINSVSEKHGLTAQKCLSLEEILDLPMTNPKWNNISIAESTMFLIHFLSKHNGLLWNYEDITARVWSIKSSDQLDTFLQLVTKIFLFSLPNSHISERWAQTALQLGLSCSSRHFAGRSLQIYRSLRVPITSRMVSDILSRLVETVAEQGEDMQGYVTELLLTLEAATGSLESNFRPLDIMRDLFKSTPNLNDKDPHNILSSGGGEVQTCLTPCSIACAQGGHARSTSCSISFGLRKNIHCNDKIKPKTVNETESSYKFTPDLCRSKSAQNLKLLSDATLQDDQLTILTHLFWIAVSLLESDYEHEFLLAVKLLSKVMHRLSLDRPDARDKVEKLQYQVRWNSFPGVHALLLKGCTHPNVYEPVIELLSQFTPLLNLTVVDPSQTVAFPMNVIALLPYMLLHYEEANEICIRSAENIAQVSVEKSKKLENLATVMNLYSRRTFSKESFQWTKCVIKYLYDAYSQLTYNMLIFLVEVLDKGPINLQKHVLSITHCLVDLALTSGQSINTEFLRVIVRYIDSVHWKEALKILKLVVTRSSSLAAPHGESAIAMKQPSFIEDNQFSKKELPGRTMDFTFDISQTPVIGRKYLHKLENDSSNQVAVARRSCSLSPADIGVQNGWKRPWMSQGRVRECLVNLLTTCGQKVGLPKSPSVIFSQTSDIIERQSSMASSTEEMSCGNNDVSVSSKRDDAATEFGVFKDFDFLEYESESLEGESADNFNWGVRRKPLAQHEEDTGLKQLEDSSSDRTSIAFRRKEYTTEDSSDEDPGSESPFDEMTNPSDFENIARVLNTRYCPRVFHLEQSAARVSTAESDISCSSIANMGDVTPCNTPASVAELLCLKPNKIHSWEKWVFKVQSDVVEMSNNSLIFFHSLQSLVNELCQSTIDITKDSSVFLLQCPIKNLPCAQSIGIKLHSMVDILAHRVMSPNFIWFNISVFRNINFIELMKYGILEMQEHLETFSDKREQTLLHFNAFKNNMKNEDVDLSEVEAYNCLLDLGRSLYKLFFQLLLLMEGANKMTSSLHASLRSAGKNDLTTDVMVVRNALANCIEDSEGDGGIAISSPGGLGLYDLIESQQYVDALALYKQHREVLQKDIADLWNPANDIDAIIHIYCKNVVMDKPDCFVITNLDEDFVEVFGRLFQVSAAVSDLESVVRSKTTPRVV